MNRKKAAAGFLAALLAVSLTACNKPATPPASSAAATTEATAPSTTMATTESTTTTTETAAATTTKKKTTTKKPKPKTTAPRKTAAPTKVTLPTNAPTGSPTPPPTSAPTENRFVLSAQGKAALARYQKGQEKFFALDSYHYTGHIQMEMNVDGHGFMMVTSSKEIYKHISARQLYATDSSSVAGEPSHQSVYIDGVTKISARVLKNMILIRKFSIPATISSVSLPWRKTRFLAIPQKAARTFSHFSFPKRIPSILKSPVSSAI